MAPAGYNRLPLQNKKYAREGPGRQQGQKGENRTRQEGGRMQL